MSKFLQQLALALAFLIAGCTAGPGPRDWYVGPVFWVMHGQVDFDSEPQAKWEFGSYKSVMFFAQTTVVRTGGTYYIIGAPAHLLVPCIVALVCLPPLVFLAVRRRKSNHKSGAQL